MKTEKRKNLIAVWSFLVVIGAVFFILGLILKLPPKELNYYSSLDDTYKVEEYVGGDAYNYIIAASQWAGEYSAKSTEKTLYICFGVFMFALGLANVIKYTDSKKENTDKKKYALANEDKTPEEPTAPTTESDNKKIFASPKNDKTYGDFTDIMEKYHNGQNTYNTTNNPQLSNEHSNSPTSFRKLQQEYQSNKETKVETTDQNPFEEQFKNSK